MKTENINELIEYPEQGIVSKSIIKNSKIEITLFCMTAGTDISEHTSTRQGIVYVLEGNGTFNLEDKKIKMEKGMIINMQSNAKHSLKAEENTSFLLMLLK